MPDNTHVPDKVDAFLLQVRHALYELISTENRIVSVESLDDVAVEQNEKTIAIQIKNVVSKNNNPISDHAVSFWKTLYNWCNYIQSETLPIDKLILKYVVVSEYALNIGGIAKKFHEAHNKQQAESALIYAKTILYGKKGEKTPASSIKLYTDYCCAPESNDTILKVIQLLTIEKHEKSYDEKLLKRFSTQPIPLEYKEELFYSMLGWLEERVHEQAKRNQAAFISTEDYLQELRKQIRGRDQNRILSALSVEPDASATRKEANRKDTYIRQLDIIDEDTTSKLEAANDYLRTCSERTIWGDRGLVTENDIDNYMEAIKRIWESQRKITSIVQGMDEIQRGQLLYNTCTKDTINIHLQGCDVPFFFSSGSLHILANRPQDHPRIGWHPRYVELLGGAKGGQS